MLQNKNEKLTGDIFPCKPLAHISLAQSDLISQDQALSPTDTASMHNRSRPFVPNAVGQSPYLSPGTDTPPFAFKPQLYTQIHTDTRGCRKAHTERHSPPSALNTSFMLLFAVSPSAPEKLPCYESGGDCKQAYIL